MAARAIRAVKLLRGPPPRSRHVQGDGQARLLAAIWPSLRPALVAVLHTGLRERDALRLRVCDADMKARCVFVVHEKTQTRGRIRSGPTSSRCSRLRWRARGRSSLATIQSQPGHAEPSTTLRYLSTADSGVRAAVEALPAPALPRPEPALRVVSAPEPAKAARDRR